MSGIDSIRALKVGSGERVVPVWGEGDASPDWRETEWRGFGRDEEHPFAGAWEGEPGTLRLESYPYDEVCVMLSGRVALIDTSGKRREFAAGEAFFVPRGFSGVWETVEPASKIFVALFTQE
ncbi:cupin domain-containing protein [Streptomyces capitiformicae]|uniref:(S)-ureidoglycine aminohydrolase cupin domain-containing protein n=1 Tax=Streptomyces capitiformicae TaxID=2014920 RepID=A0A918ZQY7_9ACTN|nr:cupin domain-containing protein [Streptomyces capitiformicae]GHE66284.1 hypothetical protein GCM10017771_89940 [Streptomyces capitiformicae]